ncbi:MAG: cysteine desulfurase [Simkaniaceae bacterium]|nr:cysteine desulfurase [Simkaniaceae bacterium]
MLSQQMHGKPLIYLDSAATTQKPFTVSQAEKQFYEEEYATVHRGVYELSVKATERYQGVREKVARFINAPNVNEVIFTKGTTESLNLVAATYGRQVLQRGDEILLSELEHHSNLVPWQMIAKERGAILRIIKVTPAGDIDLDHYESLLSDRTKIISIAHMSNVTGTIHPIKYMAEKAHHYGAIFVVDGAQAASHLPIDVQDLGCDFYAFSGHKMYGPTGVGVLYGNMEHLVAMPPYQGGGDMVDRVSFEEATYQDPPHKFEAGTPLIAQVIGLGEAVDYIEAVGKGSIGKWENRLLNLATHKLEGMEGVTLVGTSRHKGPILSFSLKGIHPLDIGTLLSFKGIALRTGHLCAQPFLRSRGYESLTRISFALYNTPNEVELFLEKFYEVGMAAIKSGKSAIS